MAIAIKFRAEGSTAEFDNVMDANYEALHMSQLDGGNPKKIMRCVLFTGRTDWTCTTLRQVHLPPDSNMTIVEAQ